MGCPIRRDACTMDARRFGSEEAIEQLPGPLKTFLIFERLHLYDVALYQDASGDPGFDRRYFPQNCAALRIPCFWIRRKHLWVYGSQDACADEFRLCSGRPDIDEPVLLPIHPASLSHYDSFLRRVNARDAAREGVNLWGVPTSSTRTLLVWPDGAPQSALFLKASLHSRVLGDRRLHRHNVAGSIGLSELVRQSLPTLPRDMSYLSETLGLVPRTMPDGGIIVRSIPRSMRDGTMIAAPLFSLIGGSDANPPLLRTMVERHGPDMLGSITDILCARFARLWLELSMRFGLIVEAHGQDLLLCMSPDLVPTGTFLYRDFEGLQVDWELRSRLGLSHPKQMPNAQSWRETYGIWDERFSDVPSVKLRSSLLQYLHLVLNAVNMCLNQWQSSRLLPPSPAGPYDLTMTFSRHMFDAIHKVFHYDTEAAYDIYRRPVRFLQLLLRMRRELLAA
jgi:hypothetical protein